MVASEKEANMQIYKAMTPEWWAQQLAEGKPRRLYYQDLEHVLARHREICKREPMACEIEANRRCAIIERERAVEPCDYFDIVWSLATPEEKAEFRRIDAERRRAYSSDSI